MHRLSKVTRTSMSGFHTSTHRLAITRFNLPAMSPTMTEGTIHKWKKAEGEAFSAGDVLLELETDKAQIDVEAAEDGVLAKIILPDGGKASVNSLIALIAEEGDDISNVEIPNDQPTQHVVSSESPKEEKKEKVTTPTVTPISHHDIDTSKLKKPLSPAVLSLVLKYGIKDIDQIKPSGHGDRILKGDVLAHLGLIKPKPAPKPTLSIAPPRDQIVFAKKPESAKPKKVEKEVLPSFISKRIQVDELFNLRQSLNEQRGTCVSVNDFIAKAAERALQDVTVNKKSTPQTVKTPVVYPQGSFSEKYTGGEFKIFNLSEPTYDFISDSYSNGKPYLLKVASTERIQSQPKKVSADKDMLDLIGYLGGEKPKVESRNVRFTTQSHPIDFSKRQNKYQVEIKLEGGIPGKVLNDQKANSFFDRVEYYIKHPNELTV